MAGRGNYFKKKFLHSKLKKQGNGYRLSFNFAPIGDKLDYAQYELDTQVWNDVKKYMPIDTGDFQRATNELNAVASGKVYLYPTNSPQGHYLYEGKLYVDPVYGKGAFYSPTYGFWSRPNVEKVRTNIDLTYSNPNATAHWGETAYKNHHKEWEDVVRRALG